MFAAGTHSSQEVGAKDSSNVEADNDWLSIGKSFSSTKHDEKAKEKEAIEPFESKILKVYKHRHDKHDYKKEKKRHTQKKRQRDKSIAVESKETRDLLKHENKSRNKSKNNNKRKKRRRSWSSSDSSDPEETHYSSHHSRKRTRGKSRSRSRSRSYKQDNQVITRSVNDVMVHGQGTAKQEDNCLFEYDRAGDPNNRFFGSTYAHDQPRYQLDTQRNMLTGARVIPTRPRYISTIFSEERQDSGRYFSLQARKMERDARQKRLYLAYSEKRLTRAATENKMSHSNQVGQAATVTSRPHETAFIPLDPVLDINVLEGNDTGLDTMFGDSSLLTDGQSVEQHLVECSKKLNAAVAASPHVINHWLNLIAFQEQTIRLHPKSKKMSSAIKASIVEKQVAILARALTSNPQSRELHRVKLNILLQSQANGENSDVDSFQRQLESLLSEDLANSELWLKLLQSRQQHFGAFSMQSVRDLYARILTVLRAQKANDAKEKAETAPTASSRGKTEAMLCADQVGELSIVLLDFHFLMCVFEKKAGYIERSIAQLQALLDFSMIVDSNDSREPHLEMLRKFGSRWNDDAALRLGDQRRDVTDLSAGILGVDPPEVSVAEFRDYIEQKCAAIVDQVNPPIVLRSKEHKRSLLSSSAVYQRLSQTKKTLQIVGGTKATNEADLSTANSAASDDSEVEPKRSSTLVYSNLHGYRISVDEADDTREYERILSELRGTENSRTRQIRLLEKEKMKYGLLATTKMQVEDQRANYDPVAEDDRFVQWLRREEVQTQVQWAPLQCSNPLHQGLIEQQPDRATLTEEIQPFLFPVPVAYRWRLVAELLHICGVDWNGEYSWKTTVPASVSMYADSHTDYELLVTPIQSMLNPQANCPRKHALLLDPSGRKMLLENALLGDIAVNEGVLRDPSKVAFVRRVFEQGLENFHNVDNNFGSKLKCLWISFEAKVARACAARGQEETAAYARRLSQNLAQHSANGDTDFDALHAYAKLELVLGNERQVRRICENTLILLGAQALDITSSARTTHRFVFLQTRLEMWPTSSVQNSIRDHVDHRMLRCLYKLWNVWQPAQVDCNEKKALEMVATKRRQPSRKYLQKLLMSDPSTGRNLIARYRAELRFAVQHCAALTSANHECGKEMHTSHSLSCCWAGYCLHNLALVVYAYNGFDAACREYCEALANAEHRACSQEAWAWTCFLEFIQQHQVSGLFPTVAPRIWRTSVSDAVKNFPFNELFLRLFVDSEMGNTISQVHRTYFLRVEKRWRRHYDSPRLVEWLFALLCEFCRIERAATIKESSENEDKKTRPSCCLFHHWRMNTTAVNRIRHIFESMVIQIQTRGSALCWGLYMRFEVALGKVDAAKKVLYRGIAACAWSKALYMDGLRVMRAYMSEDECQELLNFMEAKELNVRVDTEQINEI
ncbi:unnamed protein product [Peronospora farinosa]|uniref:Uncharacterized protein n=1 Tax=Peronospora farinosa TaxID=134698 RepID=A0AAV0SRY4_9STRA|nr:unnamed protein product [Peronospora farinosa]